MVPTAARATDRLAAAHDASHYRLVPQLVVAPATVGDVVTVLEVSRSNAVPITFRSGGTSLSGQAGTESVLVDTRTHFRTVAVLDEGARVRTGSGTTVRAVNARLARHGRKLGPDPASEIACTIGGVIANNSSGMACGTHSNSYRTLESVVLVLPSGSVVDTAAEDASERLRALEPRLYDGLIGLRDRIRCNAASVATLVRLHSIKNTMGYGLNAFLDYDDPIDILAHLVVGSEGTLAFVAEATFRTVPLKTSVATGLLVFSTLDEATAALPALVDAGFATIELMDAASLRVAQRDADAPDDLRALAIEQNAALLVEFQEESSQALERQLEAATGLFAHLSLSRATELTTDPTTRARLWRIRKGLFTAVAGERPSGTTALLEDIAVPVECLGEMCAALTGLFDTHGYDDAVIFGHAKDGNVHFLINERFDDPAMVRRYERFTEDLVDAVLARGGTLKAEHGTGRVMAPFVRRQYGDELYEVMWELKRLIDPDMLFNRGVLLTEDPDAHLKNLKTQATVDVEVDRCVECGYCEPVCPSRDLTLTPRERIVLRRERQRAIDVGDAALVEALDREYAYDGVETCAVDGMCQTACPVLINTGDLVRRLRAEDQNRVAQRGWKAAAANWDAVSSVGGVALSVAQSLPSALPVAVTRAGRALGGADLVPQYSTDLPGGGRRRRPRLVADPIAVFFPSCTGTMFGPVGGDGVAESFQRLCERAGLAVLVPAGIGGMCCGTPWKSKGLTDGYDLMKARVSETLFSATDGGRLPLVCDASSCTEGLEILLAAADAHQVRVIDAVAFVDEHVLPRLPDIAKLESITLHPTCSSTQLGINTALERVAAATADAVEVPPEWGCCGFAGDRGMLHPELTQSATAAEAEDVKRLGSAAHASTNRTCEIGMTRATGQSYEHILQVLDRQVEASSRS
nr:FAD-binding and (Fe-S)-binding domain-containing protein [Microbacterium sp. ABRD28]